MPISGAEHPCAEHPCAGRGFRRADRGPGAESVKVLVLDHHFRQDIEALSEASGPDDLIRVVGAEAFASVARKIFPPDVFGADYSRYHAPELAAERVEYRCRARRLLFELYQTFSFDVFVVPSDIYFYIRDVIEAVRDLGLPTVAVQKESGVSAQSFVQEAADLRKWFPFSGDVMTVCSERSREFWLAAGVREDRILVLGQPRFDVYRNGSSNSIDPLASLGVDRTGGRPVLLFLSYSLDAYAETRSLDGMHRPWETLHEETEQILLQLAREGRYTVLIKPHPQQDAVQLGALHERLAELPNVTVLPGNLDTRHLIMTSDVVVGFQTTAIAEAMIAGKRVVYTFWTAAAERAKPLLLPFHEMGDCIDVATSAADLDNRLRRPAPPVTDDVASRRARYCEPYMGSVDGHAARRVWDAALRVWGLAPRRDSPVAMRLRIEAPGYCRREARRARRRAATWRGLAVAAAATPGGRQISRRAMARYAAEIVRARECREQISAQPGKIERIRGPRGDGIAQAVGLFVRARIQRAVTMASRQASLQPVSR